MKTFLKTCILALAAGATAVVAQPKFHVEAGASYLALREANFASNPSYPVAVVRNDRSAWAPYLAGGFSLTDWLGLRLSYHYVDGIESEVNRTFPGDPSAYVINHRYSEDIHLLGLAPEFKWQASSALTLFVSPELNWVVVREDARAWTNAPAVTIIPRTTRTEKDFTFGASAGGTWALSESWAVTLAYKYVDLNPSWDRRAHVISGGLRWSF